MYFTSLVKFFNLQLPGVINVLNSPNISIHYPEAGNEDTQS